MRHKRTASGLRAPDVAAVAMAPAPPPQPLSEIGFFKKIRFLALALLLAFIAGCGSTRPTVITEEFDKDGNVTKRTTATVDSQVAYYEAVKNRDHQIATEPELVFLDWKLLEISATKKTILPVLRVNRERRYATIERAPTAGETAVAGVNGFMERLAVPLSIGGIATVAVQGSRTNEELKPNTTAGGDVVQAEKQGAATADRSIITEITDVGNTKDSHNTEVVAPAEAPAPTPTKAP